MEAISMTELAGNHNRTYATRQVSARQHSRRVHIAIALWEQPWKSAPNGEIAGWVIAVDAGRRTRFLRSGSTDNADPMELTLKEVESVVHSLKAHNRDVWIVTGRRRATLRKILEKRGYEVTGSFSDKNRASNRASRVMRKEAMQAKIRARKQHEAPKKNSAPREGIGEVLWLPSYNRLQHHGGKLLISCDASSDTVAVGSMCFVASNGDYQVRTRKTRATTDELELESITMALKYAMRVEAESVTIESDSTNALDAIRQLKRNGPNGKKWRGMGPGASSRFFQAWKDAKEVMPVEIRRVMGHAGDPLNKAADQIAYLALRASTFHKEESVNTLRAGIAEALSGIATRTHDARPH